MNLPDFMRLGGGQAKDMQRRRQPRIPTVVLLPNCVNIPRSTRTTGELRPLRAPLRHALVPPRLGRVFERGMTVHSGTGVGGFLGDGRVRVGSIASVWRCPRAASRSLLHCAQGCGLFVMGQFLDVLLFVAMTLISAVAAGVDKGSAAIATTKPLNKAAGR